MSDNPYVDAALLWYQQHQASKAPKFYPVPETPEQKWQFGQTQNLTDFANQYAHQLIGGMPTASGFKFISPALQGQQFSGGWQAPKFNFTGGAAVGGTGATGNPFNAPGGIPANNTPRTASGEAPGGAGGIGHGGILNNRDIAQSDGYRNSLTPSLPMTDPNKEVTLDPNHPSLYDPTGQGVGSSGPPPGMGYGSAGDIFGKVGSWWSSYKADHPDWASSAGWAAAQTAATAAFGPMGGIAVKILHGIVGGGQPSGGTMPTTPATAGGQTIGPGMLTPKP